MPDPSPVGAHLPSHSAPLPATPKTEDEGRGEGTRRLWSECSMGEEGITCSGYGQVDVSETFEISANGETVEVVVVSWESGRYGGTRRWTAIDREQYERHVLIDPGIGDVTHGEVGL